MNDLHLDEAEYALLIAINIFSAGQSIAHMQDIYTTGLKKIGTIDLLGYFFYVFLKAYINSMPVSVIY